MTKSETTSKIDRVQPSAGYILIEPKAQEEKTSGGIYLPDNAKTDKPQEGKVLKVGPKDITDKGIEKTSPVKVNDLIIYKKWGGNEVKIDGKEYIFVKFEDILAIIS